MMCACAGSVARPTMSRKPPPLDTLIRQCELRLDALPTAHPERALWRGHHTVLCRVAYQDDRRDVAERIADVTRLLTKR